MIFVIFFCVYVEYGGSGILLKFLIVVNVSFGYFIVLIWEYICKNRNSDKNLIFFIYFWL